MWGNPYLNVQFQYLWIWIINIVLFSIPIFLNLNFQSQYFWIWPTFSIPIFLNLNLNFQSQYFWIWPTFQRVVYCTLPYQSWSNQHLSTFQRVSVFLHIVLSHIKPAFIRSSMPFTFPPIFNSNIQCSDRKPSQMKIWTNANHICSSMQPTNILQFNAINQCRGVNTNIYTNTNIYISIPIYIYVNTNIYVEVSTPIYSAANLYLLNQCKQSNHICNSNAIQCKSKLQTTLAISMQFNASQCN